MTAIENINAALRHNDPQWSLRFLGKEALNAMDRALVHIAHPLAYQPGTQEHRFMTLARSAFQFEEPSNG